LSEEGPRSVVPVEDATKEHIVPIVRANIARESHLMTDEARRYERLGQEFAKHVLISIEN
jgi:hypothetical protein